LLAVLVVPMLITAVAVVAQGAIDRLFLAKVPAAVLALNLHLPLQHQLIT
jgi:hypothetical protein